MGNNATKHPQPPVPTVRHKKQVHWKTAERPSPPGRPMLFPSTENPDVIHIKWERPKSDGGSPLLGFILEYRRTGSAQWIRAVPTLVPVNEFLLSGLEPGWRYQFRIIAENVVGRSDPSLLSDGLTVTLLRNTITVPRFVKELSDMVVVENSRIEMRVSVVGTPAPEVCWFKDGYEIFSSRRTKIVNENDTSVLIIHQAALTDEGEIKCTATNRAGHVVTKAKLKVEAPPKIRLPRQYEDGIVVEADEVLRLKVAIAGLPQPNVIWCHEGKEIKHGGRFELSTNDKNSSLKINKVQRSDQGEYSLKAINKLGEDVAFILVTVTSPPTPPGKVQLSMSFGKSTRLTWTAPVDDGGCKVGNYIVEYYRVGWNVWLKAATTRQLETTLHDLIEGSQYKFRVKAENPYGLSDPSEESNILFVPDPKRGIKRPEEIVQENVKEEPKEESKPDEVKPPLPPKKMSLAPLRNFLTRSKEDIQEREPSPKRQRSPSNFLLPSNKPPQIYESDTLTREMSYGSPIDQDETKDLRRSSSSSSHEKRSPSPMRFIESLMKKSPILGRKLSPHDADKSSSSSRKGSLVEEDISAPVKQEPRRASFDIRWLKRSSDKTEAADPNISPSMARREEPSSTVQQEQKHVSPQVSPSLQRSRKMSDVRVSPTSNHTPEPPKVEKVDKMHDQSPPNKINIQHSQRLITEESKNQSDTPEVQNIPIPMPRHRSVSPKPEIRPPNPVIQISAPDSVPMTETPSAHKEDSETKPKPPTREKADVVHTSSEFMLVLYPNKKSKENEKQESFDLELDEALSPPPLSLSTPDLGNESGTLPPPMRRAFSSTELLYERAMARFYEAVELEEAERNKKRKASQDQSIPPPIRKRLGSMSEAERLSFERRSSFRKRLSGENPDFALRASPRKSDENLRQIPDDAPKAAINGEPKIKQDDAAKRGSQDSINRHKKRRKGSQDSFDSETGAKRGSQESVDFEEDYTESTASSEDSIEKFKIELMARTRTGSEELQTYHPRNMTPTPFSPYRVPTPDQSSIVLSKPVPMASPDFVPKPILKRSSAESIGKEEVKEEAAEKLKEPKKGFMSMFKKEKSSSDQNLSKSKESVKDEDKELKNWQMNGTQKAAPKPNVSGKGDILERRLAAAEELRKKKLESRQSSEEESKAVANYYNDIVREVGKTRKSTVPIYLSSEELKKAAAKADEEEGLPHMKQEDITSSEEKLFNISKQKPRLSIAERMQIAHVKVASNLAMKQKYTLEEESDDTEKQKAKSIEGHSSTEHLVSSSTEQGISSSTEQLVGAGNRARSARRMGKKTVRKVERPAKPQPENNIAPQRKRPTPRIRNASKSPASTNRKALSNHNTNAEQLEKLLLPAYEEMLSQEAAIKSSDTLLQEAQLEVRSAISYMTDLGLFLAACWIYLFKDAILVIPILLLLVYRQIGEAIRNQIPDWMKRKKS